MKKLIHLVFRHRNAVLLVFALAFGLLAAFGARSYISEQLEIEKQRLQPQQRMAQVVVAKRNLERGELASADSMATRQVPADYLSASSITPERFEQYVGGRLTAPMRAGEPLLSSSLEGVDSSTFSAKVQAGIRAVTVTVDEVNSISGMLQPGDRIDLLLSIRMPAQGLASPLAQEVTRPLMQDLRVLATGRRVRPGQEDAAGRGFTTITVEVAPDQAQRLVVAQRLGKLTAMLRNPRDRGLIDPRPMDIYGLLGLSPAPAPEPLAQPRRAEIIVGGQRPLHLQSAGSTPLPSQPAQAIPFPASPSGQAPIAIPSGPAGAQVAVGPGAYAPNPADSTGDASPLLPGRQPAANGQRAADQPVGQKRFAQPHADSLLLRPGRER